MVHPGRALPIPKIFQAYGLMEYRIMSLVFSLMEYNAYYDKPVGI